MTGPHPLRRALAVLVAALLLLPAGFAGAQDDTALFSTQVPPNVILLVDNSGSMNHIVWHPEYEPSVDPACNHFSDNSQYFYSSDKLNWDVGCGRSINLYVDPDVSGP